MFILEPVIYGAVQSAAGASDGCRNVNQYYCILSGKSQQNILDTSFFLYSHITYKQQNLQDYTTGSMEIHSNPMVITNNK